MPSCFEFQNNVFTKLSSILLEESLKEYADHFYKMGFKITAYLRYHYASCIAWSRMDK